MMELRHPYPSIEQNGVVSYGGNQMLSEDKAVRECGCGVVAALDMLLYLGLHRPRCAVDFLPWDGHPLSLPHYEQLLQQLRRRYLPLTYPLGLNGLTLAAGLNRLFRAQHIPLQASWGWRRGELWAGLERMLRDDIPVILSAGPNFPLLLSRKSQVAFCRRDAGGALYPVTSTCAHYVAVTGWEGDYLRISSWGREYFLRIEDYREYIEKHSSYVFSNILLLKEKER